MNQYEPGLPTKIIEDFLMEKGYVVIKVLSFSGLNTVVLVRRDEKQEPFVLKIFYGYYMANKFFNKELGHHLYAYKFYLDLEKNDYSYWLEKFKMEISILENLSSEFFINVLYSNLDERFPYYAMEFIDGQNLSEYLNQKGELYNTKKILSLNDTLFITKSLLEGVNLLHKKGIIHRDITPYNILIKDKNILLCDLGLARKKDIHTKEKNKTPFLYWPPEHEWDFENISESGDIFSIGTICYELLTGTLPRLDSPSISKINPTVPKSIQELVYSMIKYNAKDRPQNAEDCLKFLNEIIAIEVQ